MISWSGFKATRGTQVAIVAIAITTLTAAVTRDDILTGRLLSEAPAKWDAYLKYLRKGQVGVATYSHFRFQNGKHLTAGGTAEYKFRAPCAFVSYQPKQPKDGEGQTLCVNSHYAFEVKRKTSADPWKIKDVKPNVPGGVAISYEPIEKTVVEGVCPQLKVFGLWLPDWMGDSDFVLKRTTQVEHGAAECVRVDFEYHPRTARNNPVRSGWFIVDPNQYWLIREVEARLEFTPSDSSILNTTYDLRTNKNGFPEIARCVSRQSKSDGSPISEYEISYHLIETAIPDDDFGLGALGLPEPNGIERARDKWTTWNIWCLIGGFLALALLIGLRKWRRMRT